jgi:hypothetical protein
MIFIIPGDNCTRHPAGKRAEIFLKKSEKRLDRLNKYAIILE